MAILSSSFFASFCFATASMILGAAPVFAEEEAKVEETKEINYKEAYLQNVVAAKEAAVKEAEAKLEASKKAVEQDIDVMMAAKELKKKEEALAKTEKELKEALEKVDKEGKELIEKYLGEGKLDLSKTENADLYNALVTAKANVEVKEAELKAAKTVYAAAKKAVEEKPTDANIDTLKNALGEVTKATKALNNAKGIKDDGTEDPTIEGSLAKAQAEYDAAAGNNDDGDATKEAIYKLTHKYEGYFQAYYKVDAAKLKVVEANAKYEAVLKASPKNAGVVEATAALEAAKAELEAAKAELNAAKAGVEEKPEVVVDKR